MHFRGSGFRRFLFPAGFGALYLLLLQFPVNGFGQAYDYSLFYRVVPKEKVMAIIKKQAYPLMQKKGIPGIEIEARFASQVPTLADSVASILRYQADMQAIISGDSMALKKQKLPKKKAVWEKNITAMVRQLIESGAYQWQNLLARNFSDRILVFHSDIQVLPSAKLEVKETITVFNGNGQRSPDIDYLANYEPNNDIQRGIVRDFPTRYLAKDGFWENVGFTLKSVTRNGKESNYKTESLDNGTRIMVGDADVLIEEGLHTYVFTYETDRQVIYHTGKDELYWNVNGNGWVFSADSVSCTIQFPQGATILEDACYTGVQGSTDRFCTSNKKGPNIIHFNNTKGLEPWQGLTVAASIQNGILAKTPPRNWQSVIRDNFGIKVLGITLAGLSLIYFVAWFFMGRDPKKGTIIPQLEPPSGLSPADVGYIEQQGFNPHLFAAALVDMAVHKYLKIELETKKFVFKWTVYHFVKPVGVNPGDGNSMNLKYGFRPADLYGETAEKGKYNPRLKSCFDGLKSSLEARFRKPKKGMGALSRMFVRNDGFTGCGVFVVLGAIVFSVFYVINQYTPNILAVMGLLAMAIVMVHGLFVKIMSAYTKKGREAMDHIEGFKMYLETAEQNLYEYFSPPEKTLELFEKYLPYAIALKVENAWAEKFDDILQKALEGGYRPAYYSGSGHSFGRSFSAGAISSSLSSGLGSSTASASTPPSSSSGGSSGGGSSGGGGGGGGGGGW